MSTSLNIKTKYNDVDKTKAIPYINPNATDQELLLFAQTAIDLTNQSYQSTDRIDKVNLDTQKTAPTLINVKIANIAATVDDNNVSASVPVASTSSGGAVNITFSTNALNEWRKFPTWIADDSTLINVSWYIVFKGSGQTAGVTTKICPNDGQKVARTIKGTLVTPATEHFAGGSWNFTITVTEE